MAWVLVANRIPQLEPFAGIRNLVAGAIVILLMAIPVLRFRHKPAKMFVSGLTAWTLLTLTYIAAELRFSLLESRLGALHFFTLGAVSYGFVAVSHWVFLLCAEVRHRHIAQMGHERRYDARIDTAGEVGAQRNLGHEPDAYRFGKHLPQFGFEVFLRRVEFRFERKVPVT